MKTRRPLVVTKRDGTLERFDPAKLRNVLSAAMQRRGYDPRLADPLMRAVALHLREWAGDRPPTTQYIHQCVCAVLEQTDLEEVAADLRWHRRQRALRRRAIEVVADPGGSSAPWRKSAVARALQDKYGLRQSVSRVLAGRIEQAGTGTGLPPRAEVADRGIGAVRGCRVGSVGRATARSAARGGPRVIETGHRWQAAAGCATAETAVCPRMLP